MSKALAIAARIKRQKRAEGGPTFIEKLGDTWPVHMAKSAYEAVKLPGDVYSGKQTLLGPGIRREDYTDIPAPRSIVGQGNTGPVSWSPSDETVGRATDLGGLVMGGTSFGAPHGSMGSGPILRSKLPMDETSRMGRAAEQGYEGPWYHGSERTDRLTEKGKIDPKRATSGPMPFFTDNPEIASNYAKNKVDTSLAKTDTGEVSNYFNVNPKDVFPGSQLRAPINVERSWNFLPRDVQADILSKAKRVGYENPETSSGPYTLHPPGVEATLSPDHYDYLMKTSARGNPLAALREMWHDGGNLIGSETDLAKIWQLAGYPHKISEVNAPWTEAKGVMPAMLRMKNPLKTDDQKLMIETVLPKLEEMFKRDRSRSNRYDAADPWDKNSRYTPKEWITTAKENYDRKDNSFVWTSIPDKITNALKQMGYDGLIDSGGKSGGQGHKVAIPFEPDQVRSRFAAFDPKNEGTGLLLGSGQSKQSGIGAVPLLAGEQPKGIRVNNKGGMLDDVIGRALMDATDKTHPNYGMTGDHFHDVLKYATDEHPTRASEALREAGIPGIRREDYTDIPAPRSEVGQGNTGPVSWSPYDETVGRATDLGGLVMGGTSFGAPRGAVGIGPVRPAKENLYDVMEANFTHGRLAGNKDVPIESLIGGVRASSPGDSSRVQNLAKEIGGPSGYFERLIVDDAGNVIEGQHRLDALRSLGNEKTVPVSVIEDLARNYDAAKMRKAVMDTGGIHPDQAHGVVQQALETIRQAGSPQKALEEYHLGPFQKQFEAALNSITLGSGQSKQSGIGAIPLLSGEQPKGIPGIKYLDQGSRGAGDGTRNYVVFDPSLIEILKKYGIAGAAAIPAISSNSNEAEASVDVPMDIARRAKGGEISTPWYVRNEARSMAHTGPIKSIVPGRTDNHPMNVPAGAYILPSSHVSFLGQDNSQAGMAVLDNIFKSGPYGTSLPKMGRGSTIPRGGKTKFADGGEVAEDVPIMAAGGEYVIKPEQVMAIGGGDLDLGHKILDKWVMDTRKQHIKTLQKLPGPAR